MMPVRGTPAAVEVAVIPAHSCTSVFPVTEAWTAIPMRFTPPSVETPVERTVAPEAVFLVPVPQFGA